MKTTALLHFPVLSESYLKAVDLWMGYYRATEAYDVALCCPPSIYTKGGVIPVTAYQISASNKFALALTKELYREADMYGIYPQEMDEAKWEACNLHDKELSQNNVTPDLAEWKTTKRTPMPCR